MKYLKNYFLLLFLGIIFINCSNEDTNFNNQIVGSWNWLESSGGIAGTTETPTSTGNVITIVISNDSFQQFINGNLNFETSYTIELRKSEIFGDQRKMIIYENGFIQSFERKDDKLILYGECNDCFQSEYEKE